MYSYECPMFAVTLYLTGCLVCAETGAGLRYESRASQCYTISLYMLPVVIQTLD